jgi:hypothetical protein
MQNPIIKIIRMAKSRLMILIRWAGYVGRMGEKMNVYVIGVKARGKEVTRKTPT